ncbi:hypothetical protein Bca52824_039119 [Brassica carinata]|uniref:Uncharacterized protein n=1 Tax=Brassica carinata TaxID=52824 RepID=A0A8X7RT33_BRACI|nr:hypothetical protein Bca52824_039119 [Brassica carinata]
MRRILIYRRFSNRAIFGKFFPKVLLHSLPESSLIFARYVHIMSRAARATVREVQVYHVVQRKLWNGTLLGHRTLTCRVVRLLEFMLQLMRKIKPKVPVLRSYSEKTAKALFED